MGNSIALLYRRDLGLSIENARRMTYDFAKETLYGQTVYRLLDIKLA